MRFWILIGNFLIFQPIKVVPGAFLLLGEEHGDVMALVSHILFLILSRFRLLNLFLSAVE